MLAMNFRGPCGSRIAHKPVPGELKHHLPALSASTFQ